MLNNIKGNTIKIAAIGDSITYGYPYGPKGSWFDLAAGQYHIAYVNRGVNGDTTAGMRRRFARDVLMQEVTHVIVMGGTNDAYAGLGVNEVMHHIRAMTELALEKGIVPIIGLPIPCNIPAQEKLLDQYREEMRRYAMDNNMGWIDFYTSMVEEDGVTIKTGLYRDAVHPNKAGYQVMTAVFAKFIQ